MTESRLAIAYPPLALIYSTTFPAKSSSFPNPLTFLPTSLTTTLAPLLAKNKAYYLPIPLPAPVITATLPSYLNYCIK